MEFTTEDSTLVIRPTSTIEKIDLDRISIIMSRMTTASALLFEGEIDFPRFGAAVERVAETCPWLFCSLHVTEDQVYVAARVEGDSDVTVDAIPGYLQCELSRTNEEFSRTFSFAKMLPQSVHEKMIRIDLAMASVQDLPICALRVIQFKSHFVISYRLNHAFYDQSSIVNFLMNLSDAYSTNGPSNLAKPVFKSRSTLIPPSYPAFLTKEDFDSAAPKGYNSDPSTSMGDFGVPKSISISLLDDMVSNLRQSTPTLSSNDIIHAILLKIIGRFNSTQDTQEDVECRVLFARNMRVPFGLGSEVVGDYVRLQSLELSLSNVHSMSIMDLSLANRSALTESIGERYIRECKWFLEHQDRYGSLCGMPDFMTDKLAVVITNWSSFPYERIKFDNSDPIELLLAPVPFTSSQGMFVMIAFRRDGSKRSLVVQINSLHDGVISAVKEEAAESGLFSYE
jgi:NRPS condensation-like uncharacterized protein